MSKTVGNYTLVQKLGSGSYANVIITVFEISFTQIILTVNRQVYRGIHNKTTEQYAVKVIARDKLGSSKSQEYLQYEISIMRDYVHRNVVQLHDHFVSPNNVCDHNLPFFRCRPLIDISIWC